MNFAFILGYSLAIVEIGKEPWFMLPVHMFYMLAFLFIVKVAAFFLIPSADDVPVPDRPLKKSDPTSIVTLQTPSGPKEWDPAKQFSA